MGDEYRTVQYKPGDEIVAGGDYSSEFLMENAGLEKGTIHRVQGMFGPNLVQLCERVRGHKVFHVSYFRIATADDKTAARQKQIRDIPVF
jgi:hypothetical protein